MKTLEKANLKKFHKSVMLINGKFKYSYSTWYYINKKMDTMLNDLSEEDLVILFEKWKLFKKELIDNKIKGKFDLLSIQGITDYEKKYTEYINEFIKSIYDLSKKYNPFTDYRDNHVDEIITNHFLDQLKRRNLRKLFGKNAEKLFPNEFYYEVVKPKNITFKL